MNEELKKQLQSLSPDELKEFMTQQQRVGTGIEPPFRRRKIKEEMARTSTYYIEKRLFEKFKDWCKDEGMSYSQGFSNLIENRLNK